MSTANKIIVSLLVLIILVLGWLYLNKTTDVNTIQNTEGTIKTSPTAATDYGVEDQRIHESEGPAVHGHEHLNPEDAQDHNHDNMNQDSTIGKVGTVKVLPVNPALGVRGVGDPNAPVKIQEFFSLTCNHCAAFHTGTYQELKTKYIDTGKVYFVYQEFPLNGPALYGSMIARCLPEERYTGFIDMLLRNQEAWAFSGDFKSTLMQNAKLAGMSEEEFNTCYNNQELQKAIANNIANAQEAWNISSTPSFVVNDGERVISGGKPIAHFDQLIGELTSEKAPAMSVAPTPTTAPTE